MPTHGKLQVALRPPHPAFSRPHVAGEIRKVNVSIFDVQQKPTTALRITNNIRRGEVGCRAVQGIHFQALTAVKPYKVDMDYIRREPIIPGRRGRIPDGDVCATDGLYAAQVATLVAAYLLEVYRYLRNAALLCHHQ